MRLKRGAGDADWPLAAPPWAAIPAGSPAPMTAPADGEAHNETPAEGGPHQPHAPAPLSDGVEVGGNSLLLLARAISIHTQEPVQRRLIN